MFSTKNLDFVSRSTNDSLLCLPLSQLLFRTHQPFFIIDFLFYIAMALGKTALSIFPLPRMLVATLILLAKILYILIKRPFKDKLDNFVQVLVSIASLIAVNLSFISEYVEIPTVAMDVSNFSPAISFF